MNQPKPPIPVAVLSLAGVGLSDGNKTYAETWASILNFVDQKIPNPEKDAQRKFDARVFGTVLEAESFLKSAEKGVLVFLSITHLANARILARAWPNIRVLVLTGAEPPKGEPIVFYKQWMAGGSIELMADV